MGELSEAFERFVRSESERAAAQAAEEDAWTRPAPPDPRITVLFKEFVSMLDPVTAIPVFGATEAEGDSAAEKGKVVGHGWMAIPGPFSLGDTDRITDQAQIALALTTEARPLVVWVRRGCEPDSLHLQPRPDLPNGVVPGPLLGPSMVAAIYKNWDLSLSALPGATQTLVYLNPYALPKQQWQGDPHELLPGWVRDRLVRRLAALKG